MSRRYVYLSKAAAEIVEAKDAQIADAHAVLAEMDKLVAGLRERNAEMLAALKRSAAMAYRTDGHANRCGCVGCEIKGIISRAEAAPKPDFPPRSFV